MKFKTIELILGHNQFFNINHQSEEKSRGIKFNKKKIQKLIKYSKIVGYDGFMLSTHPSAKELYGSLLDDKRNSKKNIHLLVPYANKYNVKLNQIGFVGLAFELIREINLKKIFDIFYYFFKYVPISGFIISLFLDKEIKLCNKKNIKAIYIHEVVTDILIALKQKKIFLAIKYYCLKNNIEFGLATRNFYELESYLSKNKIFVDRVLVHLNYGGFNMNPSKKIVENSLNSKYIKKIIAMSIFASGNINKEKKVINYVKKLPKIDGMVIGTTKKKNIKKNFIYKYVR